MSKQDCLKLMLLTLSLTIYHSSAEALPPPTLCSATDAIGSSCTIQTPDGELTGSCQSVNNEVICAPPGGAPDQNTGGQTGSTTQPQPGGQTGGTNQQPVLCEATEAVGASCSIQTPDGDITGSCQSLNDQFVCAPPNGPTGTETGGQPQQTQQPTFCDVTVDSDGSSCSLIGPDGTAVTGMCSTVDNQLLCMPPDGAGNPTGQTGLPPGGGAYFDVATSALSIPIVSVDNTLFYQVGLQLVSLNPILLDLSSATPQNSSDQVSATYDTTSEILTIPVLTIGNVRYSVELHRNSALGSFRFELLSMTELTGDQTGPGNYNVVDTGQNQCYDSSGVVIACPGSGQDGAYNGNPPDYTNNNDGTVIDNVSGLMWQQSPDTNGDGIINVADKFTATDAANYCNNLVLANQDDWRLPDIKTMYSLINFNGEDASNVMNNDTSGVTPFIDIGLFGFAYGDTSAGERIIDVQYATSTRYVSTTMNGNETMFGVNLADGRIKGYPITEHGSAKTFNTQCVRGNTAYARNSFSTENDQTVTDSATGLMWEKNDSQNPMQWQAAIDYCENSMAGGYSDWRLPNAKELQSIVDYTRSPDTTQSAAIDPLFNATPFTNEAGAIDWGYYWTGTTHKTASQNPGLNAVYIAFGRALGYMNNQIMDVHGAGAQRSNVKSSNISFNNSYAFITDANGNTAITHGPQGDIVRTDNYVRCVRTVV